MFLFCWSLSLHTFCALVGFSAPRLTPRDGAEQGEPRSEEEQRAEATSARSPASATNNHSNAGVRRGRSGYALCNCTARQPREGLNPAAPPPVRRDQDNRPNY